MNCQCTHRYRMLPHQGQTPALSCISDQPVVGSIIVIQVRLTLLLVILRTSRYCLVDLLYGPIGSTCTVSHGFSSAIFLGGRRP